MNLVNTCPDIPDDWKGGITEVAKILGLDRKTLRRYADKGRKRGGIDWIPGKNGRKQFSGKDVKIFWHSF